MTGLKKILKKKKYIAVPLVLTATNHFEVIAKINGVTGRFILDTGASNTCIGFDKIEDFKLTSETTEIKAAGAGATVGASSCVLRQSSDRFLYVIALKRLIE